MSAYYGPGIILILYYDLTQLIFVSRHLGVIVFRYGNKHPQIKSSQIHQHLSPWFASKVGGLTAPHMLLLLLPWQTEVLPTKRRWEPHLISNLGKTFLVPPKIKSYMAPFVVLLIMNAQYAFWRCCVALASSPLTCGRHAGFEWASWDKKARTRARLAWMRDSRKPHIVD